MANLDQLTEQILKDARDKAAEIIGEAQTAAAHKIQDAQKQSLTRKDMMLGRAKNEAELISERIVSGTGLRIRDDKLKAKGTVIDKVMDKVKDKLALLPDADFLKFIESSLKGRSFQADEKILVKQGLENDVKKILGNVTVEGIKDLTGFIIDKNGVLENHSFETTLDYLKEDLEAQAAQILFTK